MSLREERYSTPISEELREQLEHKPKEIPRKDLIDALNSIKRSIGELTKAFSILDKSIRDGNKH